MRLPLFLTTGFFVACFVLAAALTHAGDVPALVLSDSDDTEPGGISRIRLELQAGIDAVTGYEFEVCHDEDLADMAIADIQVFTTVTNALFASHGIELTDAGWRASAVDAAIPLDADTTHILYYVKYHILADVVGTVEFSFCEASTTNVITTQDGETTPEVTSVEVESAVHDFVRGDANGDGVVIPIVDTTHMILFVFGAIPDLPCRDAMDLNDNGFPTLGDWVRLRFWMLTGDPSVEPTGECGPDPTPDQTGCRTSPPCPGTFAPEVNDDFTLSLSDGVLPIDGSVHTRMSVSTPPDNVIRSYQIGICYDDSILTTEPGNVVFAAGLLEEVFGGVEGTHDVQYEDGHIRIIGMIGTFMGEIAGGLHAEDGLDLYDVYFNAVGDAGTTTVELCESGVPEIPPLLVTDAGDIVAPATQDASIEIVDSEERLFLRGDANGNGIVDPLSDALFILRWGFLEGAEPRCMDAADANDAGGVVPIIDALHLLQWGYNGGPAPPPPAKDCGTDPTADAIDCDTQPTCG